MPRPNHVHKPRRRGGPLRSPYLWAMLLLVGVVTFAWLRRDFFLAAAVLPGSIAPAFTLPSLEGDQVSLSDYSGQVVLVNVWATWCPPCREEMPSLQRLYESLEGEDFEILAVSIDASLGETGANGYAGGDVAAFAAEYGLTFPILRDPAAAIGHTYQTTGVPESFVVGRDGIVYRKWPLAAEWDVGENVGLIRRLLDS